MSITWTFENLQEAVKRILKMSGAQQLNEHHGIVWTRLGQ